MPSLQQTLAGDARATRNNAANIFAAAADQILPRPPRSPWLPANSPRLDAIRRSVFLFVPGRSIYSVAEHDEILDLIAAAASADQIEQAARAHKLRTAEAAGSIRRSS